MQLEEDISRAEPPATADASSYGGAADSSNRPWETDSLRIETGAVSRLGLLVIAASALLAIADMALLYSPAGSYGFGSYEPLAQVPRWRLLLGHYLGILLLPAYVAGYWLVFRGLRDAGAWRAWPVFLLGSYTAAMAIAVHALFPLMALIVQHRAQGPGASALLEDARAFVDPMHGLVNALFALTSICLAAAIASGRTRFPRWLALANPLVLSLLFVAPYLLAPNLTLTRVAAPASYNLGHLAFFCLVTWASRRGRASGQPR